MRTTPTRLIVITSASKNVIPVDDEPRQKKERGPGMRSGSGNGARQRVALVTCAQLPALDQDARRLIEPLASLGLIAAPVAWDDARVDWTGIDLAVVRCCWDYVGRRAEFLEWCARVPRLANPAEVLVWNTDKHYLLDLAAAGVPIVPTTWLEPHQPWTPLQEGDWVIKPTVSIASLDAGRYRLADDGERWLAQVHVDRLHAAGKTVMIQRYMDRIDDQGETSLVYLAGTFSHAMRKAAVLTGPDAGVDRRFMPHGGLKLQRRRADPRQLEIAERALAAVPGGPERLLYARVDLVTGDDGQPVLLELELTEPQLYFSHVPHAADRFAQAIAIACSAGVSIPSRLC
jgi:glutathione synthase/RimK-type ligase-like ATP-grasp enzyme